MECINAIKKFLSIIYTVIIIIVFVIIGSNDRNTVIAKTPGSITVINQTTKAIITMPSLWWNNSGVNDVINDFEIVIGKGDPSTELNLESNEDTLIAQTTQQQG